MREETHPKQPTICAVCKKQILHHERPSYITGGGSPAMSAARSGGSTR